MQLHCLAGPLRPLHVGHIVVSNLDNQTPTTTKQNTFAWGHINSHQCPCYRNVLLNMPLHAAPSRRFHTIHITTGPAEEPSKPQPLNIKHNIMTSFQSWAQVSHAASQLLAYLFRLLLALSHRHVENDRGEGPKNKPPPSRSKGYIIGIAWPYNVIY